MKTLRRWTGRVLLAALAGLLVYAAVAAIAWRDIPAAELEARYGAGSQVAMVEGAPLRYRLEGPAHRPVLVLIHSHYFDMGVWDAWVPLLTRKYRVLRYDIAGHGLTGPDPSGDYTVAHDVKQLAGLLDALGLRDVALVGSSIGGNIAFTFAAEHPERVWGLVLSNSGGLKRSSRQDGSRIPAWCKPLMYLIPPAALDRFVDWMVADDSVDTTAIKSRFAAMWRREGNRAAEFERLRQFRAGQPLELLAGVTAPVLIQWGEANPQLPVENATQFRAALSASRAVEIVIYPGAGHLLPLERPAESAADILRFFQANT